MAYLVAQYGATPAALERPQHHARTRHRLGHDGHRAPFRRAVRARIERVAHQIENDLIELHPILS